MSDDLVKFARSYQGPPFMLVDGALKETSHVMADALEAQAAEITRLRAELATARRDGMEQAAQRLEELHKIHGYNPQTGEVWRLGKIVTCPLTIDHAIGYYRAIAEGVAHVRAAAGEVKPGEHLTEAEQERDEFFNRLGRITEYLDLPVDATAQRIIETIRERVENEREACASVEVRLTVPEGAETWTSLEAWEEALIAFDEAFRGAIRAAAGEGKP